MPSFLRRKVASSLCNVWLWISHLTVPKLLAESLRNRFPKGHFAAFIYVCKYASVPVLRSCGRAHVGVHVYLLQLWSPVCQHHPNEQPNISVWAAHSQQSESDIITSQRAQRSEWTGWRRLCKAQLIWRCLHRNGMWRYVSKWISNRLCFF